MRVFNLLFCLLLTTLIANDCKAITHGDEKGVTVPLGGNSWCSGCENGGGKVNNQGIVNWSEADVKFTVYVRFAKKGKVKVWLNLNKSPEQSIIAVSALGKVKNVNVNPSAGTKMYAGEWQVEDTGYVAFTLKGISKQGRFFASINSLLLNGSAVGDNTEFVKNNEGNFFYWGRRGPSVHLAYQLPENEQAEWFYNEVTVPEGNDVIGSYFMADGFGEGYFGFQVNSLTERHILFSVWSPYKTDNPQEIPDSLRIKLVKKGEGVHAGAFGNEGSGGQSYLNYNWHAGTTYKFLLKAVPAEHNYTTYTAWFYAPEKGKWLLIASFKRPQTHTYLKHLHSFLENFDPEQGTLTRKVLFHNQWIYDAEGRWTPSNKARFTGDNTARKGYRMDYKGGVEGDAFFLQNCGFFNDYTKLDIELEKENNNAHPVIDFEELP